VLAGGYEFDELLGSRPFDLWLSPGRRKRLKIVGGRR